MYDFQKIKTMLKKAVHESLLGKGITLGPESSEQTEHLTAHIDEVFSRLLKIHKIKIDKESVDKIRGEVVEEFIGYGPLNALLKDDTVTDIMVNSPKQVYIERGGRLERTDIEFYDDEEIYSIIEKMLIESGKRLDRSSPYVDMRIRGGIRVTAAIPPIAAPNPTLVIRKHGRNVFTFSDLIANGAISAKALEFLKCCVLARLNTLISGSTGSGKTTILNMILKELVPADTRTIVIEDTEEISLDDSRHFFKLLTKTANLQGKGEIELQELVKLSLHMRPDRIVIGEVRGEEAFNLLQAMNTGHEGSMCTIHANNCEDAVSSLHLLSLLGKSNIPDEVIRRLISSGVDFLVHMQRLPDGRRKLSQISEFAYDGEKIIVKDIFSLKKTVRDGKEIIELVPTGHVPSFFERIEARVPISRDLFKVG
jgi:pilus assembly protein CpaF